MSGDPRRILLLPEWQRITCTILNVIPLPGVGAIWAGVRNPHSPLLKHGIAQLLLVTLGSYPWIIPGVVGLAWAVWSSVRIHQDARPQMPWTGPV